jgi:hypothetical protein
MAVEIVGREAELRSLAEFLETVPARPAALVLDGEAGIGRSTLWSPVPLEEWRRSFLQSAAMGVYAASAVSSHTLGGVVRVSRPNLRGFLKGW